MFLINTLIIIFVNCEEKFSEFNELTSCAFKQIQQDCKKESDCKFKNKRFVEIINRLKTMVENDEISENEAMFRYLNLIELEESKFQYTNNKNFNYGYYPSYNDFYVRECYLFTLGMDISIKQFVTNFKIYFKTMKNILLIFFFLIFSFGAHGKSLNVVKFTCEYSPNLITTKQKNIDSTENQELDRQRICSIFYCNDFVDKYQ